MRLLALLFLATSLLAAAGAVQRPGVRIAPAWVDRDRRLCMSLRGAPVAAGTHVWLMQPDTPQRIARGRVVPGSCAALADPTDSPRVALRVDGGALDSSRLAIALIAPVTAPVLHLGVAEVDLDGDGRWERFRDCASEEGAHLTAWTGEPLKGRLRWHRYVYLGYDTELTCSERDYAEPPAADALGS